MPRAEVNDAATAKQPADTTGDFPCFVEFLARQAPGVTHGAANSIEQGLPGEAAEIVIGEAFLR